MDLWYKKVKIKEYKSDYLHSVADYKEDFHLDFCINKKQNKLFLAFGYPYVKDIRDITNIKEGEEIKFNLKGKYYALSFTVKIVNVKS